jgi:hypothetical protein
MIARCRGNSQSARLKGGPLEQYPTRANWRGNRIA